MLHRLPALALLALVLTPLTGQAAELAVNGGFETGDFTGWDQFPQTGTQEITDINPSEGVFAAHINADSPAGAPVDNVIKNANIGIGQVGPGQMVTISFDVRGTTAAGGVAFAELFSEIDGGGVSQAELLGGAPLPLNADPSVWTSQSFVAYTGPDVSGGITVQLKAGCGAVVGCVADLYFDNLSVTIEDPAGIDLSIQGSCNGPGIVDITGATPNGRVAVASGPDLGGFTLPGGDCAGTMLDLGSPSLLKVITVDGTGAFSGTPNIPNRVCGAFIQAVDLDTCMPSNTQGPL